MARSWVPGMMGKRGAKSAIADPGIVSSGGGRRVSGSENWFDWVMGADWTLSDTFTARAGYRYAYRHYGDDGTVWHMSTSGPYLGVGIAFYVSA